MDTFVLDSNQSSQSCTIFVDPSKKSPIYQLGVALKVEDPFNPSEKSRTSTDHGDISIPYEMN